MRAHVQDLNLPITRYGHPVSANSNCTDLFPSTFPSPKLTLRHRPEAKLLLIGVDESQLVESKHGVAFSLRKLESRYPCMSRCLKLGLNEAALTFLSLSDAAE